MKVLFIGDIVGSPGVRAVEQAVPRLRRDEQLDVVLANAENAADGSGLTATLFRRLRAAGVDALTLGDHIYKKKELLKLLTVDAPICKPANFPPEAPGREFVLVSGGVVSCGAVSDDHSPLNPLRSPDTVAVFTLLGRLFMRPVDCPFRAADRVLRDIAAASANLPAPIKCIFVDIHAEATGEKALIARYLDGRVSAVLGTHTHVPTADEHILPGGTAFLTDVGMTGPYDSILGRRVDRVLSTTLTFLPTPFDVATGDPRLAGAIVELDAESGKALSIRRLTVAEKDYLDSKIAD